MLNKALNYITPGEHLKSREIYSIMFSELITSPVYLVAQAFALLATIASVVSQQFKQRQKILIAFIVGNILNGIHFFLLGAYTGTAMAAIGAVRFGVAIKSMHKFWLYLFLVVNTVATYFVFEGWLLSGVSYTAATFIILSSFLKSDNLMRLMLILGGTGWLIYGVLINSIVAIIANCLFLASSIIGWWRHRKIRPGSGGEFV